MKKAVLLLKHWTAMALGKSYWHLPQPLGRAFRPQQLAGYFNDLTLKTCYSGATDADGIPLLSSPAANRFYHPITICNKALGHWDCHLLKDNSQPHLRQFRTLVTKLIELQDPQGGWKLDKVLGLRLASPYSAMAQGQAVSVLLRAWSLEQDAVLFESARKALVLMMRPIPEGGTTRREGEALILEEYCWPDPNTILNGWIFGSYGLHDYLAVAEDAQAAQFLDATVRSLVEWMPRFDAGFWSYYDTKRNFSSPFYHRLHIAQLTALGMTFPAHADRFLQFREKFAEEDRKPGNRLWAVVRKICQKLKNPPATIAR